MYNVYTAHSVHCTVHILYTNINKTIEYSTTVLEGPSFYSPTCVTGVYLIKFLIGNLIYPLHLTQPYTVLLLHVMYTTDHQSPPPNLMKFITLVRSMNLTVFQ